MAYLQSLALDIANKKQITPAEAINEAAKTMAQLEANVAFTGGPEELAGGEGLSG